MNINESEAIAIAKRLILDEYKESKVSIKDEECKIILEKGGLGYEIFGLENYWTVTFILKNSDQDAVMFDSDYIVIFVDVESGEPNWLPEM